MFVFLKIDYDNQIVDISFESPLHSTESPSPLIALFVNNQRASTILRYNVDVGVHVNNKTQLYVLLQCRTGDRCTEKELRHFWPRFISLNDRRNSLIHFYQYLLLNSSNTVNCSQDQSNQTVSCLTVDSKCWASTDTQRKCIKNNEKHSNYFIYSYNKVHEPNQLTDEHVHYRLACQVNNCNSNETIKKLSELARQFVEKSRPTKNGTNRKESYSKNKHKYKEQSSSTMKLVASYFIMISVTLYWNSNNLEHQIIRDNEVWFESGPFFIHFNQIFYSSAPEQEILPMLPLYLIEQYETNGADVVFGLFDRLSLRWSITNTSNGFVWETSFKIFQEHSFNPTDQHVIDQLGHFTFLDAWDLNMREVGLKNVFTGGLYSGNPLVLYNLPKIDSNIILSSLTNFMTNFQTRSPSLNYHLSCGLHGRVRQIVKSFSLKTILLASEPKQGINQIVNLWGKLMLQYYGKQHIKELKDLHRDFYVSKLGYYTDTGAC
ncbi:unnamed protein product, partial [Rotaria magnacalcarata]